MMRFGRKSTGTRRHIWVFALLLLALCFPTPVDAQEANPSGFEKVTLTPEERIWLKAHPRIRLGVDSAYAPFEFVDESGNYRGIAPDYLKLIGERLGVEFRVVPGLTWKQVLEGAKAGSVDVAPVITDTEERRAFLNFTRPYITSPQVIITRDDFPSIRGLTDLADKTIAIPKGFSDISMIKEDHPSIKITKVGNLLEALKAVAVGQVDATQGNLAVLTYLMQENFITNLKVAAPAGIADGELAMGVRKDWPELAAILDKALASLSRKEIREIRQGWVGVEKEKDTVAQLTPKEQAWLEAHPVIRLGVDTAFEPFEFVDENGVHQGIASDYVALIGNMLEIDMRVVPGLDWTEVIDKAKSRELDVLPCVAETTQRKNYLRFSLPYISFPAAIFSPADSPSVKGLQDYSGQKVAVVKDYYTHDRLKEMYPEVVPYPVASTLDGLKAVLHGEARAFVGNQATTTYVTQKHALFGIKLATFITWGKDELAFGVRSDWPELVSILNKSLRAITKEQHQDIRDKWVSASKQEDSVELTDEERSWLNAHPAIRVHNEKDWPPFNYFEHGSPQGLSINYMDLLASRLGLEVKYVTGPSWNEFLGMVKEKELDVMLNIVRTEDRLKYLLYTDPYAFNPNVIVSSQEKPYESIEQLFGKTVAFPKGFFWEEVLTKSFPQIKRLPVDDTLASLKAVSFGKADAALGEDAVMRYIIAKNTLSGLRISGEVKIGNPDLTNLRLGVRDDWPLLQQLLVKAMASVTPAKMNQLREKWLGSVISEDMFALTEAEKKWLAGHKEMRLGVDPAWAPFEYLDEKGEHAGISSDYTRLISKKLGVAMAPVKGASWAEIIVRAKRGEIDLLPAIIRTEEREKFLNFTEPYLSMPMVVVTREDAPFISSLAELKLKGKPLAVVQGYATQAFLERDYPEQPLYLTKNLGDALEAVSEGRAQAAMDSLPSIEFAKKRLGLTGLKVAATTEYATGIAFGVRKDWPELVPILDKALASFSNQEQAIIQDKWVNIRVEKQADWGFIIKIILLVMAVVGIILFIVIRSNRRLALAEVKARESEARSKALIESTPDALVTINRDGVIVLVNTQTERLFGYPREELQGQKVEMLVPEDIRAVHPKYRDEYFTDPRAKSLSEREGREFFGVAKDGRHIPVDISLSPVETREGIQVIAAIRDVTERKENEAAMRENLNDLEQFSRLAVGREERMIALKEEINALLQEMGRTPKYKIVE